MPSLKYDCAGPRRAPAPRIDGAAVPEQGFAQIRHRLLTVSDSVSESESDTAS